MAISAISLCSRALLKIGAGSISSFADGTVEAEMAANLYPGIRDGLLSAHPWSFATAQASLPRMEAEPVADFKYAFMLPTDFLRVISAGAGKKGRGLDYRIEERRLHCNSTSVMLSYIFRPKEENFPAFFDMALCARMAAEFCIPLTESSSRAEFLLKVAEDLFRQAKVIDGQQDIPLAIEHFPLLEVRQ